MISINELIDFCELTSAKIGRQLLLDFGKAQASEKTDGSLVTQSDQWADREIIKAIQQAFPGHGILTEEGEHIFPNSEYCWIIDPLDGTTNFARGIPIWAISLAVFHQGKPLFGYVHLPPLNQTFYGYVNSENQGQAFLNQRPITTRKAPPGKNELFSFCTRSIVAISHPFPCKLRMLGVASYNFLNVAAGWTLGGVEATPKIWDIAAVWTILKAAGGHWEPLANQDIFPLKSGQDYSLINYPTLVISQQELVEKFKPLLNLEKLGL